MTLEDSPTQIELDYAFIDCFGHPLRDKEQLSWEGLSYNTILRRIEKLND